MPKKHTASDLIFGEWTPYVLGKYTLPCSNYLYLLVPFLCRPHNSYTPKPSSAWGPEELRLFRIGYNVLLALDLSLVKIFRSPLSQSPITRPISQSHGKKFSPPNTLKMPNHPESELLLRLFLAGNTPAASHASLLQQGFCAN